MIPITPHGNGELLVFGRNQPEYKDLPARVYPIDGLIHTKWKFTPEEVACILEGGCLNLYLTSITLSMSPVQLTIDGTKEEQEVWT